MASGFACSETQGKEGMTVFVNNRICQLLIMQQKRSAVLSIVIVLQSCKYACIILRR
jgi:hypothetical protein